MSALPFDAAQPLGATKNVAVVLAVDQETTTLRLVVTCDAERLRYGGGMEEDGLGAQPHCSRCDVVMRELPGGLICPACGRAIEAPRVAMPADFDGPSLHDGH